MKYQYLVRKLLLLIFMSLLCGSISGAYAATQVVVFEEPFGENMSKGLAKIAADSFKSRLNQMNFMVLETNIVSRKVGLNSITPQRLEVLSSLSKIQATYGDVLVVFLQSRFYLPANRNAFLQSSATVVSSATEAQLLSSSIDGNGFLLPRDCDADCAQILGTRAARQNSETLAMRIAKMLNAPSGAIGAKGQLVNKVQFDLVDFDDKTSAQFIDLLVNEFPGFLKIVNAQKSGPHMRFSYYTEATNIKLQKWIAISLRDIGIDIDRGADILVKPGKIQIILTSAGKRRGSVGNPLKYN